MKMQAQYTKKQMMDILDAHRIKEESMGRGNHSRYDLYADKNTGEIIIFRKVA